MAGIEIDYYAPLKKDDKKEGFLYINDDGTHYIEFKKPEGRGNFEMINVLYGQCKYSGQRYTLINCVFSHYNGITFRYKVLELYRGAFLEKVDVPNLIEASTKITGLTEWINQSRINPKFSLDIKEPSYVKISPCLSQIFTITDEIKMELAIWCNHSYSSFSASLENESRLTFRCTTPKSRKLLFYYSTAFSKLLSIFCYNIPKLKYFEFIDRSGNEIELLISKKRETTLDITALSFKKVAPYMEGVLKLFYQELNNFLIPIDLYIESCKNKTPEISFLNITAAFETFHKNFLERGQNKERDKIIEFLNKEGLVDSGKKSWIQIARYYHLFNQMKDIPYCRKNFSDILKFINKLKESRNFYTHYTPTENEIWSRTELTFVNIKLKSFFKGLILKQLGFPSEIIEIGINCERAFLHDEFDKNQYSLTYSK